MVVFNSLIELWEGLNEVIKFGVFSCVLLNFDVCCLFDYDWGKVLGCIRSGILKFEEDDKGLWFEVELFNIIVVNDLI